MGFDRFSRRSLGVVAMHGDATMCDCGSIAGVLAWRWSSSSTRAESRGHAASWPSRLCLDELEFCNRPATDRYIVDNVRGARVTRLCPMNGGDTDRRPLGGVR
jgi:hypothetical protein